MIDRVYVVMLALRGVTGITVNTVHGRERTIDDVRARYDPDVESMENEFPLLIPFSTDKMVDPHFAMLWRQDIPREELRDRAGKRTVVTRIAGENSVSNAWNLSAYAKAPAALANAPANEPASAPDPAPEPVAPPADAPAPVVNSMAQTNRNRLALIQATA